MSGCRPSDLQEAAKHIPIFIKRNLSIVGVNMDALGPSDRVLRPQSQYFDALPSPEQNENQDPHSRLIMPQADQQRIRTSESLDGESIVITGSVNYPGRHNNSTRNASVATEDKTTKGSFAIKRPRQQLLAVWWE
jgi:hypothetical protein